MIIFCIILIVIAVVVIVFLLFRVKSLNEELYETNRNYKINIRNLRRTADKEKSALFDELNKEKDALNLEREKSEKLQQLISSTKCLLCNSSSNAKHFCYSCYTKFKYNSFDLRITNCSNTKIIDPYGNKSYMGGDGRMYRSRAEALISYFLFDNHIRYIYEKTVYYKEDGEDKTLHPDFYLPDYDVYIEYNEIKKKSYLKSKEYTQSVYDRLGFKVIIMDDKDLNSMASCLKPKLGIN